MHNKKIIAKGLIVSILLFNTPINSNANIIRDYKLRVINNKEENNIFKNFLLKFKKEDTLSSSNIKVGSTYEITLNDNEFIPDLSGNLDGYETIIVTTTGNKKLEHRDYTNLKKSGIPNIDLSNSNSDSIVSDAFSNATLLRSFKFPKNIMHIGDNAFKGCVNLIEISNIPNTVTSIGISAFEECSSLAGSLVIPNSVTNIGDNAFRNCSSLNGTLTLSESLTRIGNGVFRGCNNLNGTLVIPNSVTSIGREAFLACSKFTGELIIPDSVTRIEDKAFADCRGLTGNLLIPNTLNNLGFGVFENCVNVNKFSIRVNSSDASSDYKRDLCFKLPDTTQTVIDVPYDFNINGTWMATTITNRIIGKPKIKNIVDGQEVELEGSVGKNISLYIPAPYKEKNVLVTKDDNLYNLPTKNPEGKHIFTEEGRYTINITTDLGNVSVIHFEIESKSIENAQIAIEEAISSKNPNDIETARDLVNKLPESSKKDELQKLIDSILPDLEFELKNTTSNLDIYIKSENMLSLSLNTNNITFEDFSGVEDNEKLNALTLTISSSLPYDLKVYLANEIRGNRFNEVMDKRIFNIRANGQGEYQTFTDTETPLTLLSDQQEGNSKTHGIDFKLLGDIAHKKDIYKVTVKFEVEQK